MIPENYHSTLYILLLASPQKFRAMLEKSPLAQTWP